MTRDELIEKEAQKYAKLKLGADFNTKIYPDSDKFTFGTFAIEDYKAFANSDLNKDLQKLAVIDGKIEIFKAMIDNNFFANSLTEKVAKTHLKQLETTRQNLLTKLNLEL